MNKRKKEIDTLECITYEQLIAGVVEKFESIDNIDFSLIADGIQKDANVKLVGLWTDGPRIAKYLHETADGRILLRDGITLDSIDPEGICMVRDKLRQIAGKTVTKYLDSISRGRFIRDKQMAIAENKSKVLSEANVLLISVNQTDYDELIKYGFKNVNYFSSAIRADRYFAKHPEQLKSYHIVLKGERKFSTFESHLSLDKAINDLDNRILKQLYHIFEQEDGSLKITAIMGDAASGKRWDVKESTYQCFFDRLVEETLINHSMDRANVMPQNFVKYEDYINQERIPLPTKKSDIKILFLCDEGMMKMAKGAFGELGLNVNLDSVNNYSFYNYVLGRLGDYDIIVMDGLFSCNLVGMTTESTEQCKDTGRDLTMLVDFDRNLDNDENIAEGIVISYSFGGNLAPDSEFHKMKYSVLRHSVDIKAEDLEEKIEPSEQEWRRNRNIKHYIWAKSIMEAVISKYSDTLREVGRPEIADIDFVTAEDMQKEYVSYLEERRKKEEIERVPIKQIANIKSIVLTYLNYLNRGLTHAAPQELEITEGKDAVKVAVYHGERKLASVSLPKVIETITCFELQTLTKKGTLSAPQKLGIYPSEVENVVGIPRRPDENEARTISAIEKKVSAALLPINRDASQYLNSIDLKRVRASRKFGESDC